MLIDKLNEFSDAQAITASAASTNVLDLGAAENQGIGNELYLHIYVDGEAFDSAADDGTLDITLQTDDNAAFSSATTILTIAQLAEATLVDGYRVAPVRIPNNTQRYVRGYYTVGGSGNFTAGQLSAFLSPSIQEQGAVGAN